jgi:hypothetical protein
MTQYNPEPHIDDYDQVHVVFRYWDEYVLKGSISGFVDMFHTPFPGSGIRIGLQQDWICICPKIDDFTCRLRNVLHRRRERRLEFRLFEFVRHFPHDAQRLSSGGAGARSATGTEQRCCSALPWNCGLSVTLDILRIVGNNPGANECQPTIEHISMLHRGVHLHGYYVIQ